MAFQSRELYRSGPNGDRWCLVRETESGRIFIEHKPNISSGGQTSQMEIGDFLAHNGHGPEHQALLHLIGSLVEETTSPRAPSDSLAKARSRSSPNAR